MYNVYHVWFGLYSIQFIPCPVVEVAASLHPLKSRHCPSLKAPIFFLFHFLRLGSKWIYLIWKLRTFNVYKFYHLLKLAALYLYKPPKDQHRKYYRLWSVLHFQQVKSHICKKFILLDPGYKEEQTHASKIENAGICFFSTLENFKSIKTTDEGRWFPI